ncbi:glycosyltransferase family 39 protein [bacterium]|nr:glycosyltransferase family 39 protein [bacterium]
MIPTHIPLGKWKIDLVWIILALALIIRLINYMGIPEGDDLYYTRLAWNASNGNLHASFIFAVRWMVFLPVALMYKLFGVSEFTSLAPGWTLSLTSILLAFYIVKHETNEKLAVMVALLYASMPIELVYGSILQVAPNLEFVTLASLFFVQRGMKRRYWHCFIIAGLMLGLMPWSRITGLIWAPMLVSYLIYKEGLSKTNIIRSVVMAVTSLIPLIIQGAIYASLHNNFMHRFALSKAVVKYQNNLTGVDAKDLFFYFRTLVIHQGHADYRYYGFIGFLLPLAVGWMLYRRFTGKMKKESIFLWWLVIYMTFMTFMATSLDPYITLIRNIRYGIVFTLPIVLIISAVLFDFIEKKSFIRWISLLFFVGLVGVNIYYATILSQKFAHRYNEQSSNARWALEQSEKHNQPLYLVDRNIDRRLQFYSGYQFKNFRKIRSFDQINKPGYLLILRLGHHHRRFTMTRKSLRSFVRNPPEWTEYLGNKGYFRAYRVAPH